jgi:proline dehydrogenase
LTTVEPNVAPTAGRRVSLSVNGAFRKGILLATQNRLIAGFVRRYGMRLGAARFVAGETLDEAVESLHALCNRGFRTNTTLLGEGIDDEQAARAVVDAYIEALDRIAEEGLVTNIALKLTHLGLDVSEEVAFRNLAILVEHAAKHGNFIRIDMEESTRVDATLRIYRRLRAEGLDNVGTVLQSYLYRTEADLDCLLPTTPNLRIVKGAYLEPPTVAYPVKKDVDEAFVRLVEKMLLNNCYVGVATHDDRIIDHVIEFAERHGIAREAYEFQMLYGIRTEYQTELIDRGFQVLVATPYGPDWYHYLMRRLAERPANVLFLLKNVVMSR